MDIIKKCEKIIDDEIVKDLRDEAKLIIGLTTDDIRNEFINYFDGKMVNICCLVLDKAKENLVKEGKLIQNKKDGFGKSLI